MGPQLSACAGVLQHTYTNAKVQTNKPHQHGCLSDMHLVIAQVV